jgi:hypothetical protein
MKDVYGHAIELTGICGSPSVLKMNPVLYTSLDLRPVYISSLVLG